MKKRNGLIAAAVTAALSSPLYAAEMPVTISGLVEVEAASGTDYADASTTDIYVATVEMAADAQINDRVSAHLAYLYEDGMGTGLDEGYATVKLNGNTSLVAGRLYVPFGDFSSNMISDPLTLQLGETSEDVVMFTIENGNIAGAVYAFNGDSQEASEAAAGDDDTISFGANIAFATDTLTLGASYISNMADTDSLQSIDNGGGNVGIVDTAVAGMGVNLGLNLDGLSIIAEYVAATESFTNADLDGAITAEETPTATNVEIAYDLGTAVVAGSYQMTEEAAFLGLPETVTAVAVSFELVEGAGVGIEYANADDYDVADGGTGKSASTLTVQLAVEF